MGRVYKDCKTCIKGSTAGTPKYRVMALGKTVLELVLEI